MTPEDFQHPTSAAGQTDSPRTLAENAYLQLRQDIINGKLPPGSKLRVEHIKDAYQVGAGTLREALLLLVTDALVTVQGQRGFRVAPVSLKELEDITRVRILLEREALVQSIEHGDDQWESEAVAAFHRLTRIEERLGQPDVGFDDWETRNRAFHDNLLAACPSRWTLHFLSILYQQSERYRRLVLLDGTIPRDIHGEHAALLDAAIRRDSAEASRLIAMHIEKTLEVARQLPAERFSS